MTSPRKFENLTTFMKSDAATTSAASQAQTALTSAKAGIAKIALAIVTGQQAPAAARDQVQ